MNVLNIAWKEIKTGLRDTKTFLLMLAFPIVLILILGTALSGAFSTSVKVGDMKLLYRSEVTSPQLAEYWNGFLKAAESQGIRAVAAEAGADGRKAVRDNRYTAYAELGDNGIRFYGSSKVSIETNILQGMLTVFADRYNLVAAAVKENPAAVPGIVAAWTDAGDYVREASVDPKRQPGSIDYYAMAMTTMFALYAAFSATYLIQGEHARKTAIRLSAAPVSRAEVFAGKIVGCTFYNFLILLAVVLFSKLAFDADWGSRFGIVLAVLATEVLLAISLGLALGYLLKGEGSRSVLMIFLQIASFAGGAYFPFGETEGVIHLLLNLNPLMWANTALMKVIYENDALAALPAIGLNAAVAAAFLILAVIAMRKREAL
ncbi:ABC transporter permease subunit [Cohnella sp. CFH 77786]|uniref:ABC transporter permease n=1 Tax=Cohnella sp. CFH 77786 TaxID=2662265 RepID=UPI001C60D1AD|nr:ABC transporter permease [Cohnella sp. CFH 77786]MBW5447136.1 ABC transporter permease subunit [Cohnella sp. CFH 77786]